MYVETTVQCSMYCLLLVVRNKFVVFVLLNPIMMDQWLKAGSLKCTLEKCEGNTSVSDNCDEKVVI
jgi:hypothetical protein